MGLRFGRGRGGRPWRRLRDQVLLRDAYLCQPCLRAGVLQAAREVDHIKPISNGGTDDWENLQSICLPCHRAKSLVESRDGQRKAAAIPTFGRKPLVPVTLVCGPSGSGKTTYVRQNAAPNDLILDMDEIISRLSGLPWYEAGPEWVQPALHERNARLGALANPSQYGKCWLIVQAPTCSERRKWREMLSADVVLFAIDADVCKARVVGRPGKIWAGLIDRWWARYSMGRDERVVRS